MSSRAREILININVPGGHISGSVVTAEDYADEMLIIVPYDNFACIDLVMVLPRYRRKGWGSRLIRMFIARVKTAEAKAVLAELVQSNDAVTVEARRAFFDKQGFTDFPVHEEEHDIPPLLMIAEI
jgi:GNAT superfamily N-acetyltransferase